MPCDWVLDGGLRAFRNDPRHVGRSLAALKILVTVALRAEADGTVLLCYDAMAGLTGLSRQSVAAGKALLLRQGLVTVSHEGQGRRLRYALAAPGQDGPPAVLPWDPDEGGRCLRRLSSRRADDLDALRVVLFLCATDAQAGSAVPASVARLRDGLALSDARLRRALAAMQEHGLSERKAGSTDHGFRLASVGAERLAAA